jgi:hypothetical protein
MQLKIPLPVLGFSVDYCSTVCFGKCCSECASYQGYLKPKKFTQLKKKYGFNDKTGFNGATGCKIPRKERSVTCRNFLCSNREVLSQFKKKYGRDYDYVSDFRIPIRGRSTNASHL